MADDVQEQIPAVETEQEATEETEQAAQPVAESEGEPVAEDAGAVADEVVSPAIDWSRPDAARSVLEDPAYKGIRDLIEEARADERNTTKQRMEAESRRAAASDEVLADRLKHVAMELGVDADDERLKRTVTAFHAPVDQRRTLELAKAWIEGAKASLTDDGKTGVDMAVELAMQSDDPVAALIGGNGIVSQLWQGYGQKVASDTLSSLSLEQVPEGSGLRKEIEALVAKEVEAELAARERETNKVDPGPRASQGSADGTIRSQEIDNILRTTKPSSSEYQQAYQEKYGFAVPVR